MYDEECALREKINIELLESKKTIDNLMNRLNDKDKSVMKYFEISEK